MSRRKRTIRRASRARTSPAVRTSRSLAERRRRACEEWIHECAARLHLSPTWQIRLLSEPVDSSEDEDASISANGWAADVRLSADFYDWPAEKQRSTISHELAHLILHPMDTAAAVHTEAHPSWSTLYDRVSEDTTEFLERLLSELLPMPPVFPKGKKR